MATKSGKGAQKKGARSRMQQRSFNKAAAAVPAKTSARKAPQRPSGGLTWALPTGWGQMNASEKTVWVCLHLLLILVPIAMSNFSWIPGTSPMPVTYDQFDIAKVFVMRAVTLVALAAWGWQMLTSGGRVRRTKADWLIVAFLGWVLLTTFTSVHPPTAIFGKYRRFEGLISFVNYAAVFFLVVQMVDRPARIRSLARTLFFGGVLVSMYGLMQAGAIDPIRWGSLPFEAKRSFATYGNPDLLGGYLMFPLPVAFALALSEDNDVWRLGYWAGFFIIVLCTITARVRGAWIGAAVALLVLIAAAAAILTLVRRGVLGEEIRLKWVDAAAAAVTTATGIGIVITSAASKDPVMNIIARVKSITEFGEGSALTRFEIWESAVSAIKARPVFGWGADTFRLVFPKFKPLAYTKDAGYLSVADNVHDYPLQLGSALGLPGLVLLYGVGGIVVWLAGASLTPIKGPVVSALGPVGLAVLLVAFVGLVVALYLFRGEDSLRRYLVSAALLGVFGYVLYLSAGDIYRRATGATRYLLIGCWAAALAYIVHLSFGLSVTGSTLLLWFVFGMLMAPTASSAEVGAPSWGSLAAVGVVLIAVLGSVGNVLYVVADNHYLKARVNSSGLARVQEAQAAIDLNPFNDMYRAELGLAYDDVMKSWLGQAQQGQDRQQAMQQAADAFRQAEKAMRGTIDFVPTEYDNYVFLSNLYNVGGAYLDRSYARQALLVAQEGIRVEPYGPAVRYQAALAYNLMGETDKAIETLRAAAKQDPAYNEPQVLLADLYRRQGKLADARAVYESILKRDPNNTFAKNGLASVEASESGKVPTAAP